MNFFISVVEKHAEGLNSWKKLMVYSDADILPLNIILEFLNCVFETYWILIFPYTKKKHLFPNSMLYSIVKRGDYSKSCKVHIFCIIHTLRSLVLMGKYNF